MPLVTNKLIALAALLALPLMTTGASAENLAEVVQSALERHPKVALEKAHRKLESGYRRQADALLGGDPELTLSITGDRLGTDFGYEEYTAGLSAPVQLPSHRRSKAALADTLGRLAEEERSRLWWQVTGEVLDLAWKLRIAEIDREEAMKQWKASQALARDIAHRHRVGELSRNDLLLAQQEQLDAESTYQAAVSRESQARIAWRNYTGRETLPTDLNAFAATFSAPLPLERHPRLLALQAQLETAQARVREARVQRRAAPVLSLVAKRDRGSRLDAYTDSLGLEVSLPLGTRTPAAIAIAEAEAERVRMEAELSLARRQLQLQIAQAAETLAIAERQFELAQRKYIYAQNRMKLAKRAFELGEMNLYQMLLARREFNQASRDRKLRELDKHHAAARKNHLLGAIAR